MLTFVKIGVIDEFICSFIVKSVAKMLFLCQHCEY